MGVFFILHYSEKLSTFFALLLFLLRESENKNSIKKEEKNKNNLK